MKHIPVLLNETLMFLDPAPGQDFIDGTVGLGGHAAAILERSAPDGRLLGIDKDSRNLAEARKGLSEFKDRAVLVHDSYKNIKQIAYDNRFNEVDGVVLDLGFSSPHIDDPKRGFSFQTEGPLDMRYDPDQELNAANIVNNWSEEELSEIFRKLGEERNAHKIAAAIVGARQQEPIVTTTALTKIITDAVPRRGKPDRLNPATRVFQALRITVNHELEELEVVLPQALDTIRPGGKIVVISFHSLEDRLVKQFMKAHHGKDLEIINKKVVKPTQEEVEANPRARSAKLRAAIRI